MLKILKNIVPPQLIASASLIVLLAALQTGCMTSAHIATKIEKANIGRQVESSIASFNQYIKELQAKGDPMGDYYYALGNSDGWIEDVKAPQAITALFEKAAAQGAMDARILLALQEAGNDPKPGQLDVNFVPRESLRGWESGLAKLLPLLQQQCYVRRLTTGYDYPNPRPQVTYYSIAYAIWPNFRDGYYRKNTDGTRTLVKDPARQKVWEDIDRNCKFPPAELLDR